MRLLVCGGAGFIGSDFVRRMLAKHDDIEVTCFDKLTYAGNLDNLAEVAGDPRYTFVRGDICDREAVEAACGGIDAIVNFAAETHVDRSIAEPEAFLHTDILGTHTLLEVVRALGIPRMVQVSTDEVYGSIDTGAFRETDPILPSSPYSASKAGGDLQVLAYHTTYGLPVMITRGSNTYGPYQYPEKLIPLFVTNALEGEKLPLYGDGENVRDWLHVDDHARGLVDAAMHGTPGATYLFGGNAERTNLHVVQTVCRLLDERRPGIAPHERLIAYVTDRPGHDHRYAIDASSARDGLGWAPSRTFEEGLAETVDWYLANPDWCAARVGAHGLGRRGVAPTGGVR